MPSETAAQPVASTLSNGVLASATTVELAEGGGVSVPTLMGKTVREVTEICERLGVNPVLVGTGIVQEQRPEPGVRISRGSSVTVRFGLKTLMLEAHAHRTGR